MSLSPMGIGVSKEPEALGADLSPQHPPSPGRLLAGQEDQAGALLRARVWLDHQHLSGLFRPVPSCIYFPPSRV